MQKYFFCKISKSLLLNYVTIILKHIVKTKLLILMFLQHYWCLLNLKIFWETARHCIAKLDVKFSFMLLYLCPNYIFCTKLLFGGIEASLIPAITANSITENLTCLMWICNVVLFPRLRVIIKMLCRRAPIKSTNKRSRQMTIF